MAIVLENTASEGSTFIITVSFYDEDGILMTPTTINWSLTNEQQSVVNGRENVSVSSPSSSINIVLTGDDLDISAGVGVSRTVTVEATYDSSYGTGLTLKEAILFNIEDLFHIE